MMTKNQEHTRTLLPTDRPGMNRPLTLSLLVLTCALGLGMAGTARGADDHGDAHGKPPAKASEKTEKAEKASPAASPADVAARIREGVERNNQAGRGAKGEGATVIEVRMPKATPTKPSGALANPIDARRIAAADKEGNSREYIRAKAAAMAGGEDGHGKAEGGAAEVHGQHGSAHWEYEGENGPAAWGKMQPEFSTCSLGRRQSPVHITDADTLVGPAEPLQLRYMPSTASGVNNGHTIQVDLDPASPNTLTVRASTYTLLQFHFHHPAEERINYKGYSMVAHLVHKNDQNQLAVVAVLMDPGPTSAFINKVWTYMPLDNQDRVQMPAGALNVADLLPPDLRYYQFLGSLTTPPCTEGVLWLVLKTPVTLSSEQLRLFSKLFPNNARPTQPLNNRVVREVQ